MRMLRIGLITGILSVSMALPAAVAADVGNEGLSYAGASADPTGEKPESKTWFNDGSWWGSMWDTASSRYEIFRFSSGTQTWTSTDVPLDMRSNSRADTLWDGSTLYVASHVFSLSPASGYPSNLYRFSYNSATDTYALVSQQPINNVRSETLVIDKDSTGQLWATWVQNDAAGKRRVHVNRTTSGDIWGAPFVVPGTDSHTQVANDDISSVIAFGPDKIGVMWSNQRVSPKTFNFIVHDDTAADTTWSASVAIPGTGTQFGDDHINLKSLHSDGTGRVFAVVKTSNTAGSQPLIVLMTRSSAGTWDQRTVWTKSNNLTRPLVLIEPAANRVHAFATTEGGGKVYYKSATLTGNFPTGLGAIVMEDTSSSDINNVTSGKGNVSSTTGLLVLASNQTTQRYWHHFNALGGGGGNATPVCAARSLTVAQDSAGGDVAPSCSDADSDPLTYAIASQGTKGVASVTGTNQLHYTPNPGASGSDSFTYTANDGTATSAPATVSVTITPTGGGGTPVTVSPVADTYVNSAAQTTSYGSATTLWSRGPTPQQNSYLRFTVSGVGSASSAVLRLYVSDASVDGGKLHRIADNSWTESMLFTGQPVLGPLISDLGAVSLGYRDIDVSSYVTGDGTYSFAIIGEHDTDIARFHSREGANDPLLVVTP